MVGWLYIVETTIMNSSTDFDKLVESHSAEIFAYLWRLLRNTEDAEDCLQETYIRAFRAFHRLWEGSNQRAWFYKIATNVANTHLKRQHQISARDIHLAPEKIPSENINQSDIERSNLLVTVQQAVETLPEKQRAALLLRKYQGLDYAEIGTALKCSPEAARANVYQALKKLRSQFMEN